MHEAIVCDTFMRGQYTYMISVCQTEAAGNLAQVHPNRLTGKLLTCTYEAYHFKICLGSSKYVNTDVTSQMCKPTLWIQLTSAQHIATNPLTANIQARLYNVTSHKRLHSYIHFQAR